MTGRKGLAECQRGHRLVGANLTSRFECAACRYARTRKYKNATVDVQKCADAYYAELNIAEDMRRA
jgi:hypothetical protein